jgi:hypothetical protein
MSPPQSSIIANTSLPVHMCTCWTETKGTADSCTAMGQDLAAGPPIHLGTRKKNLVILNKS